MTKRILKDGERLRVPLQLMDAVQHDLAAHFGTCVPHGEDAMPQDLKTTAVLDGLGRLAGSRPGHCYLHSSPNTRDHAVQITAEMSCRNARDEMIQEMTDAWKQSVTRDREVPRKHSTGDALRDAYLDSVEYLTTSWARGSGRR
jgi:hypothetical protein